MQASIDHVYRAFEKYATHSHLDGCTCCNEPEALARFIRVPLEDLEIKHLDGYVGDALLTVGDVPAFKHFLPCLLELFAQKPLAFTMPDVLLSKLTLAEWGSWPQHECAAVDELLRAVWQETIRSESDDEELVDTTLRALGNAYDDIGWCLELWESDEHPTARSQLAQFVQRRVEEAEYYGELQRMFWDECEAQEQQLLAWTSRVGGSHPA
jgi:hypothetical protein